jgi:hypothetical protein
MVNNNMAVETRDVRRTIHGWPQWMPGGVVMAVALLASISAAVAFDARNVLGNWQTNWGNLVIFEADDTTFVGSYSYQNTAAKIYGVRSGDGVFEGFWVQEVSEVVCPSTVKGKTTYGRFRFVFEGRNFAGLWNYCDRQLRQHKDFTWTGTLINRNIE